MLYTLCASASRPGRTRNSLLRYRCIYGNCRHWLLQPWLQCALPGKHTDTHTHTHPRRGSRFKTMIYLIKPHFCIVRAPSAPFPDLPLRRARPHSLCDDAPGAFVARYSLLIYAVAGFVPSESNVDGNWTILGHSSLLRIIATNSRLRSMN